MVMTVCFTTFRCKTSSSMSRWASCFFLSWVRWSRKWGPEATVKVFKLSNEGNPISNHPKVRFTIGYIIIIRSLFGMIYDGPQNGSLLAWFMIGFASLGHQILHQTKLLRLFSGISPRIRRIFLQFGSRLGMNLPSEKGIGGFSWIG